MPRVQELPGKNTAMHNANGQINWRALYGEEAFRLKPPLYESELQKLRSDRLPNLKDLEEQAKQYAQMRKDNPNATAAAFPSQSNAAAARPESQAQAPASKPVEELPSGWSTAKDTAGRVYYWHTKTKKTTWERPTAETPIQ